MTLRCHLQVQPVHIETIAKGIGLGPEDFDLYGTTKTKVGVAG